MPADVTLPSTGQLTFLFTDIEGSTRKAAQLGDAWFEVLETHHAVLRPVFTAHGGAEVSTAGDSFFVVFTDAANAVAATVAMQRAIAEHDWSPHPDVRVRMGLHTGPARFRPVDRDYAGLTVHAASRVESAAAGAQVLLTQATLDAATADWPEELDVLDLGYHRLKDLPAELKLYQLVAPGLPRDFPPVRGVAEARNNVPVPPSAFIGRSEELSRLHHLVDDSRLVTVVGTAGTGKTRVALRIAAERLHRHPGGVWFAELATARDEADVVAAIAAAAGVREERDTALIESVITTLRGEDVLVVVDNCEQVVDAAATVVDRLVRSGPAVRVLATSREPLDVDGERTHLLPPLAADDGVALFLNRVSLLAPEVAAEDTTSVHARTIVDRLDGLPLALELAAANVSVMSVEDIAQQLDDRFALLTRGKRTAADRQKTLHAAIEWSYGLLDVEQQRVFRSLGVFPAEFDFGVVAAVCGDNGMLDDSLTALQRKSLVAVSPSTRLRFLESIRQFARGLLDANGETAALAESHARFFANEADRRDSSDDWIDVIAEDLQAALGWGASHDLEVELKALVGLQPVWKRRGLWRHALATSKAVLAATASLQTERRMNALSNTATFAIEFGDRGAARTYIEEASRLAEMYGGSERQSVVLGDLGGLAAREGDFETAEELYTGALAAARSFDNPALVAAALTNLAAVVSQRGDVDRASELANHAIDAARSCQWAELDLSNSSLLGVLAHQRGDLVGARQAFSDARALADKLGFAQPQAYASTCLAQVEVDDGHPRAAIAHLRVAVQLDREIGSGADLVEALEATARVAGALRRLDLAPPLVGAADRIRADIGFARQPSEVDRHEALLRAIRAAGVGERGAAVAISDEEAAVAALRALDELEAQAGG